MKKIAIAAILMLVFSASTAWARASYQETISAFKQAGVSASFFDRSYGYAVFPTVATGAFVVGAAYGKGPVYVHGRYIGDTAMGGVSVRLSGRRQGVQSNHLL